MWVRLTFFLPGNEFFLLFAPIEPDGTFRAYVLADCEHLAVQIVDDPYAIVPGQYTVLSSIRTKRTPGNGRSNTAQQGAGMVTSPPNMYWNTA